MVSSATQNDISWWLRQTAQLSQQPLAQLQSNTQTDVLIVGGGFTGLWTAICLKRCNPQIEVSILEAKHCGFGASGRNGGWLQGTLSGWFHNQPRKDETHLIDLFYEAHNSIEWVRQLISEYEIECDFEAAGTWTVATNEPQASRVKAEYQLLKAYERQGRERFGNWEHVSLADHEQLNSHIRIPEAKLACFRSGCARIDPGKLVNGLKRTALDLDVQIYENSRATSWNQEQSCWSVVSQTGFQAKAKWLVWATEAYGIPKSVSNQIVTRDLGNYISSRVVPINSAIAITEPLDSELWQQIGWRSASTILTAHNSYNYLQRTADGRIAIGGRGKPYRCRQSEQPVAYSTVTTLKSRLTELFGDLVSQSKFDMCWQGTLGSSRDMKPHVLAPTDTNLIIAGGYAGEGVAASALAARSITELIVGSDKRWLTRGFGSNWPAKDRLNPALCWNVGDTELLDRWESRPVRYLGINAVYRLLAAGDSEESLTGRHSFLAKVAHHLTDGLI